MPNELAEKRVRRKHCYGHLLEKLKHGKSLNGCMATPRPEYIRDNTDIAGMGSMRCLMHSDLSSICKRMQLVCRSLLARQTWERELRLL